MLVGFLGPQLSAPAHVPAPPVEPAPSSCIEALPQALASTAEQSETLKVLAFQERLLRAQLRPIGGLPIAWPEGIESSHSQAAVQQALLAADEAVDVSRIEEIDCSEFPCLVWMENPSEPSDDQGVSTYQDGQSLLEAAGFDVHLTSSNVTVGERSRRYSVGVATGIELEPDVAKRVGVRSRRAMETFRERLQAEGDAP